MTDTTEDIDTDQVDDFLAHFGVKGMHWGQRNAESTSGSHAPSKSQLIKEDRSKARRELADRDRDWKAAHKEVKSTKRGTVERRAAEAKLTVADNAWAATHERANQVTAGETARGVAVGAAAAGAYFGARFAAKYIVEHPEKVASFLNKNKSNINTGLKAVGSMGRNLPYSKIAKGVYTVTKVKG